MGTLLGNVDFVQCSVARANALALSSHSTFDERGQYQKPPTTRLYPVFGPSKSSINGDITAPSLEGFFREVEDDVPWEGKESNRLLWRGDTSGLSARKGVDWTSSHRHRLALSRSPFTARVML